MHIIHIGAARDFIECYFNHFDPNKSQIYTSTLRGNIDHKHTTNFQTLYFCNVLFNLN